MSWNHRVMRATDPDGTPHFTIHEVYYHEDGQIKAWTERPVSPCGDSLKELQGDLSRFERAFTRPILNVRPDGLYDVGLMGRRQPQRVWTAPTPEASHR